MTKNAVQAVEVFPVEGVVVVGYLRQHATSRPRRVFIARLAWLANAR